MAKRRWLVVERLMGVDKSAIFIDNNMSRVRNFGKDSRVEVEP